jgi:anti-sigma B factor antagonist
MAAKANIRQVGDVLIVDLSGRIALGDGSGAVRETVKDMLKEGQKNILLNLGDVTYIDSAGLGELVGAYATVSNQGGHIKLLNVQKKVNDLLQVTKLYTVFESFTSETAAVRSFGGKSTTTA